MTEGLPSGPNCCVKYPRSEYQHLIDNRALGYRHLPSLRMFRFLISSFDVRSLPYSKRSFISRHLYEILFC